MSTITRFAPSPTGYLHIGGARTALFNWLFAKHTGGKFLLRIEDTDRARSTPEATAAILDGLKWLGLQWDDEPVYQFSRAERHAAVARELVEKGQAYYCYMTAEEINAEREAAKEQKKIWKYDNRWRNRSPNDAPKDIPPAIRLKAPTEGEITIEDQVQGSVTIAAKELDDMVLLRADGTPTYMLAVVVDDHDMGTTHIIRGDDHLTNAFRQKALYQAMSWDVPKFAHIPLIHGPDGAKLSKRHGALGIEAYRDMGYLPEALRNYLLRLGWAHGNDEIISTEQATQWFTLEGVGKSPSRLDFAKLENLNGHYLREADETRLVELIWPLLHPEHEEAKSRLLAGMPGLKARAKTLKELAENAAFYVVNEVKLEDKARDILIKGGKTLIEQLLPKLESVASWKANDLEALMREFSEEIGQKLGNIAQALRAAITGKTISPSMFEVMEVLGREETLARLQKAAKIC